MTLQSFSSSFSWAFPKVGINFQNHSHTIISTKSASSDVTNSASRRPAALNIFQRDRFNGSVHIPERELYQRGRNPFGSGLYRERIRARFRRHHIQEPGNFKPLRKFLEPGMQERMQIRTNSQPHPLSHGKRLPAVRTRALCKCSIYDDGDLRP